MYINIVIILAILFLLVVIKYDIEKVISFIAMALLTLGLSIALGFVLLFKVGFALLCTLSIPCIPQGQRWTMFKDLWLDVYNTIKLNREKKDKINETN